VASTTGEPSVSAQWTQLPSFEALNALNEIINTGTVVDVFVYDTSKDTIGTLSNSLLGFSLKPVMLIVSTTTTLDIYDATDAALPSLKTYTVGANNPVFAAPTSVAALNGHLVYGTASGLVDIDLVNDTATKHTTGVNQVYKGTVSTEGLGWA